MKKSFRKVWKVVDKNANGIMATTAILAIVGGLYGYVFSTSSELQNDASINIGTMGDIITKNNGITFEQHRAALKEDLAERHQTLETAHASDRGLLSKEAAELERKLANAADDYGKKLVELAELKKDLKRFSNTVPTDHLAAAMEEIDQGDRSLADKLLEKIERDGMEGAANAVYLRGNIASAEIRWSEAASLYSKAADLEPSYKHLYAARDFQYQIGEYEAALALGDSLIAASRAKFGENSKKHAAVIKKHATLLDAFGYFKLAVPLYLRVLEIDKATVGDQHPDYLLGLYNLGGIYEVIGNYTAAEQLYKQAIGISKVTNGEDHSMCALQLNILANLYYAMGDYPSAEPLYKQAIAISQNALPPDHPQTKTFKTNLAAMQAARDKG